MATPGTLQRELADRIFDTALLTGTFVLRSGATSDVYFDKYRVSTNPSLLRILAEPLWQLIHNATPAVTCIVAPELGAVPLATAVSLVGDIPIVIVRAQGKEYGTAHRLEGIVETNAIGVLLEDVVTSGGAAIDALEVARAEGVSISASVCLLDRGAGGSEALAAVDAPLSPLFNAVDWARQCERIRTA